MAYLREYSFRVDISQTSLLSSGISNGSFETKPRMTLLSTHSPPNLLIREERCFISY